MRPSLSESKARWLVLSGAGVSVVGDGILLTGLAWSVIVVTGSAVQLSVVLAAISITLLAIAPFSGQILDLRRGPSYLACSESLAGVTLLGAAGLLTVIRPSLIFFLLLGCSVSLFSSLSGPGLPIMVARLSSEEQRPNAISRAQVAVRAGRICGPLVGGVLVATGDFRFCCVADAASYLISAGCWFLSRRLLFRPDSGPRGTGDSPGRLSRLTAGLRFVTGDPYLRGLILVALVANSSLSFVTVTVPLLVKDSLHEGSAAYGFMQASFQAGLLVSSAVLAVSKLPARLAGGRGKLGLSLTALGASFALMGLARNIVLAAVAILVAGVCLSLTSVISDTKLVTDVPPELQGRVFGVVGSLFGALRPAGSLLGGGVAAVLGVTPATAIAGAALALTGGAYQLGRRTPAQAAPPKAAPAPPKAAPPKAAPPKAAPPKTPECDAQKVSPGGLQPGKLTE